MASVGRGRGRGLLISRGEAKVGKKEEPIDASISLEDISKALRGLDVAPDDPHIQSTCNLMTRYITNTHNMSRIAELLYEHCIQERDFTYAAAKLIHELQGIDLDGVKFRTSMMTLLQSEFKNKDALRASSTMKFLGLVALLCQMFGTVRIANKEPMKVLTVPIFQCLELIVTNGNEEEVECLVYQLEGIGQLLEDKAPEEMVKFTNQLRQAIVSQKTPARVRCMLLELFETWYNKWQSLPPGTANLYADLFSDCISQDS